LHKKYFSNIHQFSSTYQVERMIELWISDRRTTAMNVISLFQKRKSDIIIIGYNVDKTVNNVLRVRVSQQLDYDIDLLDVSWT
jgi:hypothetical protein